MPSLKKALSLLISYTLVFMALHAANLQTDGTTNTTLYIDVATVTVPANIRLRFEDVGQITIAFLNEKYKIW